MVLTSTNSMSVPDNVFLVRLDDILQGTLDRAHPEPNPLWHRYSRGVSADASIYHRRVPAILSFRPRGLHGAAKRGRRLPSSCGAVFIRIAWPWLGILCAWVHYYSTHSHSGPGDNVWDEVEKEVSGEIISLRASVRSVEKWEFALRGGYVQLLDEER